MRQTPVNDYLEEISTRLPEEIYGYLSDAIYETVCEFDEEVAQLKAENAKLRELAADMWPFVEGAMDDEYCPAPECLFTELCTENQVCMVSSGFHYRMRELGVEVSDE